MNPNLIDAALEQHLLTLPGAPSIAWEDVAFKPATGQAYLQVNQLRNSPIEHGISSDLREDRGVLQVTVVHPAGEGKVAAVALAHQVASHFPVDTRWRSPPMGGVPIGLQWEAIYPLMDRQKLGDDEWNDLHDDLMVLEMAAVDVMREFAPKPEK